MDLLEVIKTRTGLSAPEAELALMLCERYSVEPSLESFGSKSFRLQDRSGRWVSVALGQIRENQIHANILPTDIVVLATGTPPIMIGWTFVDACKKAEDRWLVNTKALYPMPTVFDFAVPCPHLDEFGGYYDDENDCWICFGCNTQIFSHKISIKS